MSETCEECGQVVSKAETLEEIYAALKKFRSPYSWASNVGQPEVEVPNVGKVQVVELSENYFDDPGYSTNQIFMVLEINGNKFFRIEGEKSSYDGTVWNSYISPVRKQKKEIWVYE